MFLGNKVLPNSVSEGLCSLITKTKREGTLSMTSLSVYSKIFKIESYMPLVVHLISLAEHLVGGGDDRERLVVLSLDDLEGFGRQMLSYDA